VHTARVLSETIWLTAGAQTAQVHGMTHFKCLIYVHHFITGYIQIFSTGWLLNVKKHKWRVLTDFAGEVGVSGLSVGG